MRALVLAAPNQLEIQDWPRLHPAPEQAEIEVTAAAICTSDIAGFLGRTRLHAPPLVLGHELVGRTPDGRRVVADPLLGCGHCVECRAGAPNLCPLLKLLGMDHTPGCFADFVSIPKSQIHQVPPHLSDAQALYAEPLANVVHMFRRTVLPPFFCMGIIGAGAMGSLALKMALRLGVREVLVEDVDESRLAAARQMGATLAVSPGDAPGEARNFAGHGLDLVLDACGEPEARQRAFDLCRPGGTVVLLGMASNSSQINFAASIRKEHRVVMSFGYTPEDFKRSLAMLIAGEIDLSLWTTEMPLEQGQQAFQKMSTSRGETLKMVLRVR